MRNENIVNKDTQYETILERVISITLKINKRRKSKIVPVHTQTIQYDGEIEDFNKKINKTQENKQVENP